MEFFYLLFFFLTPAGVLYLAHHQSWAKKIGVILLCYLAGLVVGNSGLVLPQAAEVQGLVTELSVALALPMLLFTLDIRRWSRIAGKAILSMLLATTSVVTVATVLFHLYRDRGVESGSQLAAMSVGMYTGGTPNLAAIKTALDIPHGEYIMFHTLDTLFGGAYILVMLTVGIPFFRSVLGRPGKRADVLVGQAHALNDEDYAPLFRRENLAQVSKILALGFFVLGAALALSRVAQFAFGVDNTSALTIVLLTTLGMSLSFSRRVRGLALSYRAGMYLIYVFCFTVATMASLADIGTVGLHVVVFVLGTILGSLSLHAMLCKLAGVDSDTFIVTSVSAICSPPFVPMFAKAMANPGVLLSGMTTGIIGYALGNYLGISLALLLRS